MTDVTIYFDNRNCIGFELYGHSGFEEEGHDIVCAAISSAAMMTINGIGEVLKQDMDLNIEEQGPRIKDVYKRQSFALLCAPVCRGRCAALVAPHPRGRQGNGPPWSTHPLYR